MSKMPRLEWPEFESSNEREVFSKSLLSSQFSEVDCGGEGACIGVRRRCCLDGIYFIL